MRTDTSFEDAGRRSAHVRPMLTQQQYPNQAASVEPPGGPLGLGVSVMFAGSTDNHCTTERAPSEGREVYDHGRRDQIVADTYRGR